MVEFLPKEREKENEAVSRKRREEQPNEREGGEED